VTASANVDHRDSGLGANARFALSMDRVVFVDDDGDGIETSRALGPIAQLDLRLSWAFLEQLVPARSEHQDLEISVGVDNVLDAGGRLPRAQAAHLLAGGARPLLTRARAETNGMSARASA
jgi:hypothetical protein